MSQQMDDSDFMEFVHDAQTNTIQEIVKSQPKESFNPEESPLPPLPKNPPPSLKRNISVERPKESPPLPPTPTQLKSKSPIMPEIVELLPAKFESFPRKQTPNFVNENSAVNVLVTEDQHREILLAENEIRNAIMSEYDDKNSSNNDNNSEILTNTFSPTNPFLDDTSSSVTSFSYQGSPNVMSPTFSDTKSSSHLGYTPVYRDFQRVSPINIFPSQPQVLPVHYSQLPKPQHAGYSIMSPPPLRPINTSSSSSSHQQFTHVHYNPSSSTPTSTGIISPSSIAHQQQYYVQPIATAMEQKPYLVSGDGQINSHNNFIVTHNTNNNNNHNNALANNQYHPALLMQSAYNVPMAQHHHYHQQQQHNHNQSAQSIVIGTPQTHIQQQFVYEQHEQQTFSNNNHNFNQNVQYVQQIPQQQQQQHAAVDPTSQLSPIRINQNFVYTSSDENQAKPSMSTFGKSTEV